MFEKIRFNRMLFDGSAIEAEGIKVGRTLALHRTEEGNATVIHIPTGMILCKFVPEATDEHISERCLAAEALGFNWDATAWEDYNPDSLPTWMGCPLMTTLGHLARWK